MVYINGDWRWVPASRHSIWPYMYLLFTILYSAITLYMAYGYRKVSQLKREKRQAAVLIVSFLLFITANIVVTIFKIFPRTPSVLVYPMVIYIFGLYYAVFKYRFLAVSPALVTEDIISHISDMVMMLDTKHKIITANNAARELLSANAEKLKGTNFFKIIFHSNDIEEKLNIFQDSNEDSFRTRLVYVKEKDDTILTDTYFSKVKDKFTDIVGTLVISKEIKGRKEFQKAYSITERELEISDLILAGHSNKSIGEKLNISERTVETHCNNIYTKLGIKNKADLVKFTARFN
jgi:PAS domain S-box-containing protein